MTVKGGGGRVAVIVVLVEWWCKSGEKMRVYVYVLKVWYMCFMLNIYLHEIIERLDLYITINY